MIALLALSAALASDRAPLYAEVDGVVGLHTGMLLEWGNVAGSGDVAVAFGRWDPLQRTGVFARVGFVQGLEKEIGDGIGDMIGGPVESFRMLPVRAGLKLNLWPRPDWIQIDLCTYGSVSIGQHRLYSQYDYVAAEPVVSPGGGAALELMMVKGKQAGVTTSVGWTFQPAFVKGTGMLASGYVGLGGLEIGAGYVVFLGGPR